MDDAPLPQRSDPLGRRARYPWEIPWSGLVEVLSRVWVEATKDLTLRSAAACAFYSFFALFPALISLVSVYGLVSDPRDLTRLVNALRPTLPESVLHFILTELSDIIAGSRASLTFSVVISLLFTWLSASRGVLSLIEAVNLAYDEVETRGFIVRRWLAFRFTVLISVVFSLAIVLVTILPTALGLFGLEAFVRVVRWPIMGAAVALTLATLYRYAPNRTPARWAWVSYGAVLGTIAWIVASYGLATYVDKISDFNATYGALGAIVVLQLWFFCSAFAIILGAEFNAELEHQTGEDTTIGPARPMGERAAAVADKLGELTARESLRALLQQTIKNAHSRGRRKDELDQRRLRLRPRRPKSPAE